MSAHPKSMGAKLQRMIEFDSGSFHTVTDPRQAQLLTDPTSKAFFVPFLARELSASQAASELGRDLNTVLYRIKVLLAAGLIEVTREQKRKGRAIKHYRSVYDAYLVPFGLTPYISLEERLEAQAVPIFANLIRSYASAVKQSERYGNCIVRTPEGDVLTTDFVPELTPAGLPVAYSDTVVSLQRSEALGLAEGLHDLYQRALASGHKYKNKGPGHHDYFLMVAFLPLAK